MKKERIVLAALAAVFLASCGRAGSPVGLIDVQRITANWPQYANANNQMLADERAVEAGKGSPAQKQREVAQMQAKYSAISQQLVGQIRTAAAKVAAQRNLKLIVTRQFVGYGGVDITPDVEKAMGITESSPATASP